MTPMESVAEIVRLGLEDSPMLQEEATERGWVVAEALEWIGTPYHHAARVKGAGVDCGMFILEVYERAGLTAHVEPADYPHDWHLHRDREDYLSIVREHLKPIAGNPQPGDVVTFKYGRCTSHGAIVLRWPWIIHSFYGIGVEIDNVDHNRDLQKRVTGFFSYWGEA